MKKTKLNYPTEGAMKEKAYELCADSDSVYYKIIHAMNWYQDQIEQDIEDLPLYPFDVEIQCEIEKEIVHAHYQKLKNNEVGSFMFNQKHLVLSAEVTDKILIDFCNFLKDVNTRLFYDLSARQLLREFLNQ